MPSTNQKSRHLTPLSLGAAALLSVAITACTPTAGVTADTTAPTVAASNPPISSGTIGVPTNRQLTATFDEPMNASTINSATFTLTGLGGMAVAGTVSYDAGSRTATFTPNAALAASTTYNAKLSTGVKDAAGNPLAAPVAWSFTTGTTAALGPQPVVLGTAGNFVLLAKTGISTTGVTAIVGDIAVSPAARSYITGFSDSLDATGTFATSTKVTGKILAANMTAPTPSRLTTAISDMQTAYTDAAGRSSPNFTEHGTGSIGGMTLTPGLYRWGTGVSVNSDVTLSGGLNDVWIFQVAQGVSVANGKHVILAGGAQPKNIFWQVAGQVTLGTTSTFKGIILGQTGIVMGTGAVLDGRGLAQTAITLDANTVTQPSN
ncbi:MAG TPA: ice-binding family protein [Deinococcales bacterium]|nr:ice-binding family protein [Deinococcales bacterium]